MFNVTIFRISGSTVGKRIVGLGVMLFGFCGEIRGWGGERNDCDGKAVSTSKGLKAVTAWLMKLGLLSQLSLATEQLYQ